MNPFEYHRSFDVSTTLQAHSSGARFLAGGTNLIDLMKNGVEKPPRLIDINRLALAEIQPLPGGGLRLGALARNADTANHPLVRAQYPLLSRAILSGASPQLRNLATNGGNLLQRTRCPYFMYPEFPACNKRVPGSGCAAIGGSNRIHAILGASEACVAVHPSDMCIALAALDATVLVRGTSGERSIPFADFHRLPGETPHIDTNLNEGELIVAIDLPPSPYMAHSHYLKVRDRASYDFALVSVAAALDIEDGRIHSARIALGGVAHKPWRAEAAERTRAGKTLGAPVFNAAAAAAVQGARPLSQNAFKIPMVRAAIVRALSIAGGIA
jgi:xanthine dehydrogenase YagS FAD-binding subunit